MIKCSRYFAKSILPSWLFNMCFPLTNKKEKEKERKRERMNESRHTACFVEHNHCNVRVYIMYRFVPERHLYPRKASRKPHHTNFTQ
jgi:hypothetical protein